MIFFKQFENIHVYLISNLGEESKEYNINFLDKREENKANTNSTENYYTLKNIFNRNFRYSRWY